MGDYLSNEFSNKTPRNIINDISKTPRNSNPKRNSIGTNKSIKNSYK